MAAGTNGMNFRLALILIGWSVDIMAVAAVFFLMAIDTAQPKQINMLLMVEGYHSATLVRRIIGLFRWYCNDRMRDAQDRL